MLKINTQGMSLLEAFLAAVIFVISVAAVFTTLIGTRRPAVNNDQMTTAALVAKNVLEDLRSKVDALDYPTGNLSSGTHTLTGQGPSGLYNVYYNVTLLNALDPNSARQVNLTVTWPDAVP
ncbi:MAG: hypothetical protein HY209_06380 [Candidatus Omnitrophica bacterium]|nr:hypothetical protein [Candidatus Omnitrophota bacterium]